MALDPRARGVGRPGPARVTGGRERYLADPELFCPRNPRGSTSRLEGPRRVQSLILNPQLAEAGAGALQLHHRGQTLAKRHDRCRIVDGQKLPITPHRRRTPGKCVAIDGAPNRGEVVTDEQW